MTKQQVKASINILERAENIVQPDEAVKVAERENRANGRANCFYLQTETGHRKILYMVEPRRMALLLVTAVQASAIGQTPSTSVSSSTRCLEVLFMFQSLLASFFGSSRISVI